MLVTQSRKHLVFVSPVFLFPNDAGGKIRTTNILRGLKGGKFRITLVGAGSQEQAARFAPELQSVCDSFIAWEPKPVRNRLVRSGSLLSSLPVNVVSDRTRQAMSTVMEAIATSDADIVVFDFVHSAVLMPEKVPCASICFTHNVEAEIFKRHAETALDPWRRWLWKSQYKKMAQFERKALTKFTSVIAVSERDARFFGETYQVKFAHSIPTGVDLSFFNWQAPQHGGAARPPTAVFTGSMDWDANINGVEFFLKEIWSLVLKIQPEAKFVIVGRNPPSSLAALARDIAGVSLTGFVEDVRPYVHNADAFVIPLLVGGGTRIKAFEAMAMGCPIVSTSIGTEGLGAVAGEHFLERDTPEAFADAILNLFKDSALRTKISKTARRLVEEKFGHKVAAQVFEEVCVQTLSRFLSLNGGEPRLPH
jgi:polysaccharide biosynthesis protein PslH